MTNADVDICSECHAAPFEKEMDWGHTSSHPMIRLALHTLGISRPFMILAAQIQIHGVQEDRNHELHEAYYYFDGEVEHSLTAAGAEEAEGAEEVDEPDYQGK